MSDQQGEPGLEELTVVPTGKTIRDEPDDEPVPATPPTTDPVDPTPSTTSPSVEPSPTTTPEPAIQEDPVVPTGKTIRDEPDDEPPDGVA